MKLGARLNRSMMLIDAIDYSMSMLSLLSADYDQRNCFKLHDKKEFTQAMGDVFVEFEVPVGWELAFSHETFSAGFRGIAGIDRCHLSQQSEST